MLVVFLTAGTAVYRGIPTIVVHDAYNIRTRENGTVIIICTVRCVYVVDSGTEASTKSLEDSEHSERINSQVAGRLKLES